MWLSDEMLGIVLIGAGLCAVAVLLACIFWKQIFRLLGLSYWEVRLDDGPPIKFKKKPGIYESLDAISKAKRER